MRTENKIALLEERIKKLEGSSKNVKCPSVLKSLRRELRNLKNTVDK